MTQPPPPPGYGQPPAPVPAQPASAQPPAPGWVPGGQPPPPGHRQPPLPAGTQEKGYWASLFDMSFSRSNPEKLAKYVFTVLLVFMGLCLLAGLGFLVGLFGQRLPLLVVLVIVGLPVAGFLLSLVLTGVRLVLDAAVSMIRSSRTSRAILEQVERLPREFT